MTKQRKRIPREYRERFGRKLKVVRNMLSLSQDEAAKFTGLSQRDISLLENGKREFTPTEYIYFLNNKGIDLNWLFNEQDAHENENYLEAYKRYQEQLEDQAGPEGGVQVLKANTSTGGTTIKMIDKDACLSYPEQYLTDGFLHAIPSISLPGEEYQRNTYRCFQAEDDLMAETINQHDYVLARRFDQPYGADMVKIGAIYVVVTRKLLIVGRITKLSADGLFVHFDQGLYEDRFVPFDNIVEMWLARAKFSFSLSNAKQHIFNALIDLQQQFISLETKIG